MNVTFGVPFSPGDQSILNAAIHELYKEVPAMEDEFKRNNQLSLSYWGIPNYELMSKIPINKPDDMKGMRIALAGGKYLAKAFGAVGATTVFVAAAEQYQALQTGVVVGAILALEYHSVFKHHEVAKHVILIHLGGQYNSAHTINKDVWDRLSSADQKLMREVGVETEAWIAEQAKKRTEWAIDTMTKGGAIWHEFSTADKERWAQMTPNIAQEWANDMEARGLPGKKIVKTFIQIVKDKGYKWPREWTIQ